MSKIKISDLQPVDRIHSQEELFDAIADSVARAVKARGDTTVDTIFKTLGRVPPFPTTMGILYVPEPPGHPLGGA